ncbi:MAG: alpha-amylase family glycosyl hydrolase [Defluviitaleaceae bacterium]|nr:alpha-amylase family glycosyl hydrolase [Defluviitaleaceae bacterium]MCL2238460.1 alpha-amylase family glycosyl hydrolase [Defluviitaleaceae bacterium]
MGDVRKWVLVALFAVLAINVAAVTVFLVQRARMEPPLQPGELRFANPYNLPETPHGGNILHAWNMSFVEITNQLPYIARAGFGVVQTSPIGAALIREPGSRGNFGRWYDLYQPTRFAIGNYLGTKAEFETLTREAAAHGIFIIVDAIPNHTTAYWHHIDPALRDHEPSLFHSRQGDAAADNPWIRPMDFGDRRSFVRSNLLGLWDFYTARPEFQALYMAFLDEIITAGASGFRFDAAHHIELPNDPPDIASDFWPVISTFVDERVRELGRIPFQYGETLGSGYRANHYLHGLYELSQFMISPYAFSRHILNSVSLGFLRDGEFGWNSPHFHVYGNPRDHGDSVFGPAFRAVDLGGHLGFAEGVVPWVESHDQYGNAGMSRHLTDEQIIAGWALIAARQGTSPLFFVRPGPGFVNSGTMFIPQPDGSFANAWGHQLLYRDPAVAAINWFANDFRNYPETTGTHGNVAIIQRGPAGAKTGAVLANVGDAPVQIPSQPATETLPQVLFPVEMVDGTYQCQITELVFTVADGWLTGVSFSNLMHIPPRGVLVLRKAPADAVPLIPRPITAVYPPSRDVRFSDPAGVEITLIAKYMDSNRVSLFQNDTLILETDFNHGDTLRIGAGAAVGDVFHMHLISVDAMGSEHHRIRAASFIKEEEQPTRQIRVEYVRNTNPWERAGVWAWNDRGDVFHEGWPGPEMAWLPRADGEGYAWVFYLPEDTDVPVTLIFNNFGGGEQTVPYLTIAQSTRVFQVGDGVEIGGAVVIEG